MGILHGHLEDILEEISSDSFVKSPKLVLLQKIQYEISKEMS